MFHEDLYYKRWENIVCFHEIYKLPWNSFKDTKDCSRFSISKMNLSYKNIRIEVTHIQFTLKLKILQAGWNMSSGKAKNVSLLFLMTSRIYSVSDAGTASLLRPDTFRLMIALNVSDYGDIQGKFRCASPLLFIRIEDWNFYKLNYRIIVY